MRKFATLFTMLMLFSALAFGQDRSITGTVTDEAGAIVPGASIKIKGTNTGTAADQNGQFRISAKTGDVLVISGTNIEGIEFPVGAGNNFDVKVKTRAATGSEVIVTTSLGIRRQQRDLGYATTNIKNELLTQAAPVNAANGLQGKVSGMNISTMDNSVFENVKINIRGIRSLLGNNNPLLVLDGVQTSLNFLSSLNPNDITDITVLKGASAAAIYGPDSRNGAIIVTTKRGNKADKTDVSFTNTTQVSRISFFPKFQEQFGSGGYGDYIPYENWSWGPAFDGSSIALGSALKDGTQQMVTYSPNDSRKQFFNTAITNQMDLSINAKDFFLSVQDVNIKGLVPKDKNRRTGLRMNTGKEFGRFKVSVGLNYIRGNYNVCDDPGMANYNAGQNVGLNSGLLNLIFNTPAHVPITSYKDWKNNPFGGFDTYFNHYGLNPYMAIDTWRRSGVTDDILANLEFNFKAHKNLNFTWRVASTYRNVDTKSTSTGQIANGAINVNTNTSIPGSVGENSSRSARLSSEFFGSYTKTAGKFKFNAIGGTYVRQSDAKSVGIANTGIVVPGLFAITNRVGEYQGSYGFNRTRSFSLFGSVSVNYNNWLNLEFTGRNDKISILDEDLNSYFYPGVSLAAVLTDAFPSIKSDVLSYVKLRASWNKTGNADIVGAYSLAPTFSQTGGFPFGTLAGYTANNGITDSKVRPEFIKSYEFGAELELFKRKLSVGVSYYNNDNTDQIIPVSVSASTGYTTATVNAASFTNKGVELDVALNNAIKFGGWKVNLSGNASYNTSTVNAVYPGLDRVFIGGFGNAGNYALVGQPAMTFLVKDYLRDDQGRIIVSRTTGLPTANPNLTPYGRTSPTWTMGFTPNISYKAVSLSIVAEYKTGHVGYGRIGNEMAWTGVSAATAYNNRERFVIPNSSYLDPNTNKYVENTNITINDVTDFYTGVYRQAETNFLYDASSWRIREVSLSWDLPKSLFGKSFIKGATFTANARNLFLWVPGSNQYTDPDFNFDGGNSNGVTTSSINPATRTFGASLNLNF
jgi:TonB-linked SusC/RagA family outer membrane protein